MFVRAVAGVDDADRPAKDTVAGEQMRRPGQTCRTTTALIPIASMFFAVSMNVSPLLVLEPLGEKSMTSAPSRRAARPKLIRVRVEGSKNRLATTLPFRQSLPPDAASLSADTNREFRTAGVISWRFQIEQMSHGGLRHRRAARLRPLAMKFQSGNRSGRPIEFEQAFEVIIAADIVAANAGILFGPFLVRMAAKGEADSLGMSCEQ